MAILKRRSRPITFRLSAEEHDLLSRACRSSGARSISDFARRAVWQQLNDLDKPKGNLNGDLNSLSIALGDLDRSLRDVSRRIRAVLGDEGGEEKIIRSASGSA